MKKHLFLFVLSLVSINLFSQCPVSVQITANLANPVCKNTPVQLTAVPINGGATPQYFWILDGDTIGTNSTVTTSVDFAFVELKMVSSSGCLQDTATANYTIINTMLTAVHEITTTECNQPTADVEIIGIIGNPIGNEPYAYDFIVAGSSLGQKDTYKDIPISMYPLFIVDSQGCTDTTWIDMNTVECPPPIPLETITPNGDGFNDTWQIKDIQFYPNNEVFIFDRWGQRVYHKNKYDNSDGWDAKYVGIDMPVSTYYYILKIKLENSDDLVLKGPISIFR